MTEKRVYADRTNAPLEPGKAAPAETGKPAPAEQRKVLSPAEFSSKGISFTISADPQTGVNIGFHKGKTKFGPGFDESVHLLDVGNLGIISKVFARHAPNGLYSVGVVYKDKSELAVTINAAANGNGVVVFDPWDRSKKAYFFGDAASQLSDFIAGTEYADKFKIESSNGILSIISTGDGLTMTLKAEPAIYAEYYLNGFIYITNSLPGYQADQSITIIPDGKMFRHPPASE
jgi:hypothetical protein